MHFGKHSIACDEMLELVKPLILIYGIDNAFVFLQAGSGYVLTWELNNSVVSTPVDKIIEDYNSLGRLLDGDDLLSISI